LKANKLCFGIIMLGFIGLFQPIVKADVFNAADFRISTAEKNNIFLFSAQIPTVVMTSTDIQWPDFCQQLYFTQQPFVKKRNYSIKQSV